MNKHPSHDWQPFEDEGPTLMCADCYACTCCTDQAAESPCTYDFIEGKA